MSQKATTLFSSNTNTGLLRMEGVAVVIVEWWIQTGLQDLESVADQVNFEAIRIKKDDEVGSLILLHRDFYYEMLRDVAKNEAMHFIWKFARQADPDQFDKGIQWRLACAIG